MKRVSKGYRVEKRCADELKAQGYLVWKTIRVRYCNIDLFGLFDVSPCIRRESIYSSYNARLTGLTTRAVRL